LKRVAARGLVDHQQRTPFPVYKGVARKSKFPQFDPGDIFQVHHLPGTLIRLDDNIFIIRRLAQHPVDQDAYFMGL
jgi:hypothetical protein